MDLTAEIERMKHVINETCSCLYCTMIDIMSGDPELNKWAKEFVVSVAQQGWQKEYSEKQKAVIKKLFQEQKTKYRKTSKKTGDLQC